MKVAFVGPLARAFAPTVQEKLGIAIDSVLTDEREVIAELHDTDVMVTLAFSKEMGEAAKKLQLVQLPGAGLDRIDLAAIPSTAWLANVYGHETGIAEFVFAAMLTLSRRLMQLDSALRRGEWLSQWAVGVPAPPPWPELTGKTLGIVGYGRIGQAIAKRAHAFDMNVLATRRDVSQQDPYASVHPSEFFEEMLAVSDFLAITVPLTESTKGLIGARQLSKMKKTAILVNIARGALIDEAALYAALRDKRIAAAAIDVWYAYPAAAEPFRPSNCPFHELDNILMTPHISGWTDGVIEARCALIAENIVHVSKGRQPKNMIPISSICA